MTKLSDFLNFRKLITIAIVKGVYAIGAILITLGILVTGGEMISSGMGGSVFGGFGILGLLAILVLLLVCNIVWRVYCEFIIVIFGIHETLQDIKNKNKTKK